MLKVLLRLGCFIKTTQMSENNLTCPKNAVFIQPLSSKSKIFHCFGGIAEIVHPQLDLNVGGIQPETKL